MSQFERAMERMYGDIGLTDELKDDEANVLLAWGAAQHEKFAAQGLDEETFAQRAKQIRRAMDRINNFIGKRHTYDPEKAQAVLARFTEGVCDLGYTISGGQANAFLAAQPQQDNMAALQAMLGLMAPADDAATDSNDEEDTGAEDV